jgi:hypothetical protein
LVNMPMTLVSVVIPAYDAAKYLGETIESCLAQTYPAVEIIVVDDGSTDETAQVVARYPQVRYVHQPNRGVSSARNCGARHASGEFIQLLDADDILLPAKIARCMNVFAASPEAGLVYSLYETRTADMRERHTIQPNWAMPEGLILRELVSRLGPYFVPSCVLIRHSTFDSVGGFDEELLTSEDWEFLSGWPRRASFFAVCMRCWSGIAGCRTVCPEMPSISKSIACDPMNRCARYLLPVRSPIGMGCWRRGTMCWRSVTGAWAGPARRASTFAGRWPCKRADGGCGAC